MFKKLREHLTGNKGDANISKMTLIAIIFVVGAILLVMTTSAFRGPINRWFSTVTNDWFASENGMFDLGIKPVCYINNKEWKFEEGMTWAEWAQSEYSYDSCKHTTRLGVEAYKQSLMDYDISTQNGYTSTLAYKDANGTWIRVYTRDIIDPNLEYAFVPTNQSKSPA